MSAVDRSEFIGGRLTGRMFEMADAGLLLFGLAVLLLFWLPRISAAIAITASLSASPLCLYLIIPGVFHRMFRGEWSVHLNSRFVWNTWAVFGEVALLAALFVSVQSFYGVRYQHHSR